MSNTTSGVELNVGQAGEHPEHGAAYNKTIADMAPTNGGRACLSPVTAASRPTSALRRRRLIQGERDANRPQRPRHYPRTERVVHRHGLLRHDRYPLRCL